ncbi:Protein PEROXIN-4 [Smittium culicis]|uniref:Protein PEROXIN-4 n=1 Tax=Smittium culicis TaxID=133412 RepID=A0A1R1Y7K6_9FUNG|nr:Protein PEROXIN-4 [Smittium culicis]
MASLSKRLTNEYSNINKNKIEEILYLSPREDDLTTWTALVLGPKGSPYSGGAFQLDIKIPTDYPISPPKIKFATKVCHPNVNIETGEICLDILKDEWSPVWTIKTVCSAIVMLLTDPEPNSPLNIDAANLMRCGDIVAYNSLVKMYTDLYSLKL